MNNKTVKSNAKRIAFLILPYFFVIVSALSAAAFLFVYITSSGIVQLAINKMPNIEKAESHLTTSIITEVETEQFPAIKYESQWATLNVEGWNNKNIPVFSGDTNSVLVWGAGTPSYSLFCGQGGRIVIDAHVTTFFREIEETEIGTRVNVSTVYGEYVYKVDKIQIFDPDDITYIAPTKEKEELVMYTCYPYNNNYMPRKERIALICSLVSGKEWHNV